MRWADVYVCMLADGVALRNRCPQGQAAYYPTMEDRKWAAERLAERGWGKPKQDVVIDDHETIGFQIVFRQWPQGYDPLAKGEKPYQPRPDDREAHGKLALPPLKDPTPHKDGDGNGSH